MGRQARGFLNLACHSIHRLTLCVTQTGTGLQLICGVKDSISPSSQLNSHIHGWIQSYIVRFGCDLQLNNKIFIRCFHVCNQDGESTSKPLASGWTTHLPYLLTLARPFCKETVLIFGPSIFRSSRFFETILLFLWRGKRNIIPSVLWTILWSNFRFWGVCWSILCQF